MTFLKKEDDEKSKENINKRYQNTLKSTYTRTIRFDNSMTSTQINAIVAGLHKHIPEGHEIIFQFADGTYNLTESIDFGGFYGGGLIRVFGNASDFNLGTTKSVFLDFSSDNGITFIDLGLSSYIYGIKIRTVTSSLTRQIYFIRCPRTCYCFYNYCLGTSISNGVGIAYRVGSSGFTLNNYVSNMKYGLNADLTSDITSNNNHSTGTIPAYGLYAIHGTIRKFDANQPTGSVANELATNGGQIL